MKDQPFDLSLCFNHLFLKGFTQVSTKGFVLFHTFLVLLRLVLLQKVWLNPYSRRLQREFPLQGTEAHLLKKEPLPQEVSLGLFTSHPGISVPCDCTFKQVSKS